MPPSTTQKLTRAIGVVTFLLAAFGGVLKNIAPPEETGISLVLGLASLLCLMVFLFITAITPRLTREYWLAFALAAGVSLVYAGMTYQRQLGDYTFIWTPTGKVYLTGGLEFTDKAAAARKNDPGLSTYDLVAGFGGIDPEMSIDRRPAVWPEAAIHAAGRTLTIGYVWTVLSAAIAIFCLTEGALRPARRRASNTAPAMRRGTRRQ